MYQPVSFLTSLRVVEYKEGVLRKSGPEEGGGDQCQYRNEWSDISEESDARTHKKTLYSDFSEETDLVRGTGRREHHP